MDVVQRFLILLLIYGTDVPAEQNENIIFVESFVALIDRDPSRSVHAVLLVVLGALSDSGVAKLPIVLIVPRVYTQLGQSMRNTYCRYRLIRSMITLCWTIECILSYFLLTKSYRNRFALNDELMLRNTGTVS